METRAVPQSPLRAMARVLALLSLALVASGLRAPRVSESFELKSAGRPSFGEAANASAGRRAASGGDVLARWRVSHTQALSRSDISRGVQKQTKN